MKRLHFLLLAGILLTACGGDDDVTSGGDTPKPVTPSTPTSWSLEITSPVTRGLNGESGSGITPTWETTDNIYVYYGNQRVGVLHPKEHKDNASSYVQLEGNLDTPVSGAYSTSGKLSFYYQCDKGFNDYTGQDGTLATIASRFDYHKAENVAITAVDVVNRKVTVGQFNFVPQQAIARFTFSRELKENDVITITGGASTASVTLSANVAESYGTDGNYVYIALPLTTSSTSTTLDFNIQRGSETSLFKSRMANKMMQNGKTYKAWVVVAVQLAGTWWATRNLVDNKTDFRNQDPTYVIPDYPFDEHEYESGTYFAWGDKSTRISRYDTPYTLPAHPNDQLSTDNDAAYQIAGPAWRMPTQNEAASLAYDPSTPVVVREGYLMDGVYGLKVSDISNSDKYIFLPAYGYWGNSQGGYTNQHPEYTTNQCHYWTSTYWTYTSTEEDCAARFYFNAPLGNPVGSASVWADHPNCGCLIRPVLNIP